MLILKAFLSGAATAVVTSVAAHDLPALCDLAAADASLRTGVPLSVLRAVALTETGRLVAESPGGLRPWPWAVNLAGDSHWFATQQEAARQVRAALATGETNVDLGCFQLNHRWHAAAFASVEDMLDPGRNALYAAFYLQRLHASRGDWSDAAGAYHSATPVHAERYRRRFDAILADLDPVAAVEDRAAPVTRSNRFPLLLAGAPATRGSIVPLREGGQPLFGKAP